jgi:hypothetical protein
LLAYLLEMLESIGRTPEDITNAELVYEIAAVQMQMQMIRRAKTLSKPLY